MRRALPICLYNEKVRIEGEIGSNRSNVTFLRSTTLTRGLAAILFSYDEFLIRPTLQESIVRVTIPALGSHIEFAADRRDLARIDGIRRAACALLHRFAAEPAQKFSSVEKMIINVYQALLNSEHGDPESDPTPTYAAPVRSRE